MSARDSVQTGYNPLLGEMANSSTKIGYLKNHKVEVIGITVTTVLVTAVVVTAVVACFFTLGMPGLIVIAATGVAAVFTASGTAIYSCIHQQSSNTSETAKLTSQEKAAKMYAKKQRIDAEWELFANKKGNADQFIREMVDLIELEYRDVVNKDHPDVIYRTPPDLDMLRDLQSEIARSLDVSSGMLLVKNCSSTDRIKIFTNLLKKFVENLTPETQKSVSDETLNKLDAHLLGLCAFGNPPVLPTSLFLCWMGSLVVFDYKKSTFLQQVNVETLIRMNNDRLKSGRPTGWVDADFKPTHLHAE